MTKRSPNVTWHSGHLTGERRAALLGQRGAVLWLTGLSGSGKSTLAMALEAHLVEAGRLAYVLDGDNIRHGLNADLGFAPADRRENVRRIGEVARLFADAGLVVLAAFISPYRADRRRLAERIGPGWREVHVATALEVCEARDPKGLYARARSGEIPGFTGISAPYEAPEAPWARVDTAAITLEAAVESLAARLEAEGVFGPPRQRGGPAP